MKAISTKYLGPTNVRGSRIKAEDSDGNSATIGYPHDGTDPHVAAAVALCEKMGWTGTMYEGGTKTGSVFVFKDDNPIIVKMAR